jgi:RNA polymerase sigma-70 factor (ECF subfamily)
MKVVQPGCGEMISWPEGDGTFRVQTVPEISEVTRAAAEKEALFRDILENRKTVFWICLGYARDFVEAEELAQEVFFKAWTKIDSVRDRGRHREWLCRVARNTCLDYQKKRRLRRLFQGGFTKDARDMRTPETLAVYRDELRLLKSAVRALPRKLKETFILRGYGGLSYREIAAILEIKEGTVMSRLSEAREKIKSRMRGRTHGG